MIRLSDLVIPPWVKTAVPVAAIVLTFIVFRFVWLPSHDRAVRAEYLVELQRNAAKASNKAADKADKKQEQRNDAFEKSQAGLANAASPDNWAERLRAEQCRAGKIASPC